MRRSEGKLLLKSMLIPRGLVQQLPHASHKLQRCAVSVTRIARVHPDRPNLPGYPDNLMCGMKGRIRFGLAKPRGATIDTLAAKPFLRKMTLRLPKFLWPVPPTYGHVIAFDKEGKIVADLRDPSGKYPETTGVAETANRLYIQSLHAHGRRRASR